jgi:plasmid maintenance system antidote protein VapI
MMNTAAFTIRLKKILEFYNLSAASFAESIAVPRSSISHILSGRNKPSLDFVLKITKSYPEVDLYWLLEDKGTFPRQDYERDQNESSVLKQSARIATVSKSSPPSTPSLFEATQNGNTPETAINEAGSLKEHNEESESILKHASKELDRIVMFYKDGTFEEFTKK